MLRLRPYQERDRSGRTAAQRAATNRNFRIFRLRGLHAQLWMLTGWRRKVAQWLVDRELALIGAETEGRRRKQRAAKMLRIESNELPF